MRETITINTTGGDIEVPKNWINHITEATQINVFKIVFEKGTQMAIDVFEGLFCNGIKVDPPPFIRDETTGDNQTTRTIITLGGGCSERANDELRHYTKDTNAKVERCVCLPIK